VHAALLATVLALVLPGDHAAATYASGTLRLTFHYEMTCGQPGPGPLTIQLPNAFRLDGAVVTNRPSTVSGHVITVTVPEPTGVTCMSITEGTLGVTVAGVHAPAGTYVVRAGIRRHLFTARLRVP
jgi:hypothetical protein